MLQHVVHVNAPTLHTCYLSYDVSHKPLLTPKQMYFIFRFRNSAHTITAIVRMRVQALSTLTLDPHIDVKVVEQQAAHVLFSIASANKMPALKRNS